MLPTGLKVHAYLDPEEYPAKIRVRDDEMNSIKIKRSHFHGEWNYTIKPE